MKDKVSPTIVEDTTPPENQNEWNKQGVKSSSSPDNPIGTSDEILDFLGHQYLIEITDRITNETEKIICLPWIWEICHETWLNFDDASDLQATIVEHVQNLILLWLEWDWIWIDGVVNEDGIFFKNVRVSRLDN